jgi:signal peptide peptidase SppA
MTDAEQQFIELMREPEARQAFVELKSREAQRGVGRSYQNVLRAVSSRPWAILEPMFLVVVDVLTRRVMGDPFSAEEIEARVAAARRPEPAPSQGGVAVIPLSGVIVPKADMFSEMSGGTSVASFRENWRSAMAANEVTGIVLDVDSPGGMVDGVPEMAAEMRGDRGRKPVVAVANTEMASGAYWLASQADEIVVSASSRVGSIGVFVEHVDESQSNAISGKVPELIYAGKHKVDTAPHGPLSDEGRATLQAMVDDYYTMFVSDVAAGRRASVRAVRSGYGEGRVVGSAQAIELGLADRSGSVESVVRDLLARGGDRQVVAQLGGTSQAVDSTPLQYFVGPAFDHSGTTTNQAQDSIGFIEVDDEIVPEAADEEIPPQADTPSDEDSVRSDRALSPAEEEEARLRATLAGL